MFNSVTKKILFASLCICCLYCCLKVIVTREDTSADLSANVVESAQPNYGKVTESMQHGLLRYQIDEDTGEGFVTYEGRELCLDYKVITSGMLSKGIGFMIYINGVPQLYRVGDNTEYKYMHTFYLEDDIENFIEMKLVPNVGSVGDELELCIVSVYYPDYVPDMKESKGYGIYHHMAESIYVVKYKASPDEENIKECIEQNNSYLILNETQKSVPDEKEENGLEVSVYFEDSDVTRGNYYYLDDEEGLHVRVEISGSENVEYRCIFYTNHIPVLMQNDDVFHFITQKKEKIVLEADLKFTSAEKFDTFYMVLVPCNVTQNSDKNVGLKKTNSVLLLSEEDTVAKKEIFLDEIPGHIFFLGNDKMLIWGDNTVLLDLNSMEIIKKVSNEELGVSPYQFTKCNLISDKEGYTLAGILRDTKESITYLALLQYDEELCIKQFINLEKVIGAIREVKAYKFSDDGTKLLYSTINGFYLYDFDTKETKMLYGEGMVVDNCGFFSDNRQILFTGDKNNGNVVFDRVFGSIDVNTNELAINEEQHLWGELWCFEDLTLIEEADVYNKENERAVFTYNKMGELQTYSLVDESENFHIYPSQEGHYYATRSRAPEGGYIIRIYGAEDGRLQREIPLTYEEYGAGIRLLNILICEERNQVFLLVQGWGDTTEGACLVLMDM